MLLHTEDPLSSHLHTFAFLLLYTKPLRRLISLKCNFVHPAWTECSSRYSRYSKEQNRQWVFTFTKRLKVAQSSGSCKKAGILNKRRCRLLSSIWIEMDKCDDLVMWNPSLHNFGELRSNFIDWELWVKKPYELWITQYFSSYSLPSLKLSQTAPYKIYNRPSLSLPVAPAGGLIILNSLQKCGQVCSGKLDRTDVAVSYETFFFFLTYETFNMKRFFFFSQRCLTLCKCSSQKQSDPEFISLQKQPSSFSKQARHKRILVIASLLSHIKLGHYYLCPCRYFSL